MGKLGQRDTGNLLGGTLEASEVVQQGTKMCRTHRTFCQVPYLNDVG